MVRLVKRYGSFEAAVAEAKKTEYAELIRDAGMSTWWAAIGRSDQTSEEANAYYFGLVVAALEDGEPAPVEKPKPRHRHPASIPTETVKQLKLELAQRKARPRDREFTQEKIAARLGLSDRSRVQQAEALQRLGWDLLRSDPEFSANDGSVRWPSARKAARLLASGSAEN